MGVGGGNSGQVNWARGKIGFNVLFGDYGGMASLSGNLKMPKRWESELPPHSQKISLALQLCLGRGYLSHWMSVWLL